MSLKTKKECITASMSVQESEDPICEALDLFVIRKDSIRTKLASFFDSEKIFLPGLSGFHALACRLRLY